MKLAEYTKAIGDDLDYLDVQVIRRVANYLHKNTLVSMYGSPYSIPLWQFMTDADKDRLTVMADKMIDFLHPTAAAQMDDRRRWRNARLAVEDAVNRFEGGGRWLRDR